MNSSVGDEFPVPKYNASFPGRETHPYFCCEIP